jgi:alpha-L-arabinofuranosidase
MPTNLTRRQLIRAGAAASFASLLPRPMFSNTTANKKAVVHADNEIGTVRPEFHSHFAEHLGSCAYGGIWVGKKSPIENINGFRKSTVDYLKELGVPVLRWPGGCFADDYHWREGIGPAEKRPRRVNVNWGKYVEDNSFGTHEFLAFCKLIGSQPYLAANVGTGTPQEVRDWIEYCNFPKGSALADERAANGSPEPFKVRYWGIGNELWGCGGNFLPQAAGAEFRRYATFARLVGNIDRDNSVYLVGCGPSGDDSNWTRGFMEGIGNGPRPNGYSMHYYEGGDSESDKFTPDTMYRQLNIFPAVERSLIHQRALLDGYDPNRQMGLILDEWGVWDQLNDDSRGKLWQQSSMRSAVAAGLGLNIFNRQADKLFMCNIAQLINVLQAVLLTDGPEGKVCVRTTTYHAFMLFKQHRSKRAVHVEYDGALPTPGAGRGNGGGGGRGGQPQMPELSVSASRQGSEMVISFVNPRHDVDMEVECEIRSATAKSGTAQILHDPDINACNGFDNPDRVTIKSHPVGVEPGRVKITLPAMSVATVTLQVA